MLSPEFDSYTPLVSRFMQIEDITWGDAKKGSLVRYRGRLYQEDTAAAYEQAVELLKPLDITPLFRLEDNRHVVLLVKGVIRPKPSNPKVNALLFALTLISVLFAGAIYSFDGPADLSFTQLLGYLTSHLNTGLPFAISLIAILGAHEFGHYLAARFHKTHVTLPYFIPFPLSPLGTMGAFIQIKELPKNRRIMLDIGLAGPIAGLLVAIPVLLLGIHLSAVDTLPAVLQPNQGLSLEGNSLLYLLAKFIVKGELLPKPVSFDIPALLYWVRYFFTGTPIPWGGKDVLMHPIAWAGWAGLLVTSLNLIPAGQLDGGHLMYVLLGKRAIKLVPYILVALLLLGIAWSGWWLWAFLIFFLGRTYMEPLDQITTLDTRRRILAWVGILIFVLVFTPVPLLELIGH
jgi:membrane-associated protease RseP (regulator of RpoE activity)